MRFWFQGSFIYFDRTSKPGGKKRVPKAQSDYTALGTTRPWNKATHAALFLLNVPIRIASRLILRHSYHDGFVHLLLPVRDCQLYSTQCFQGCFLDSQWSLDLSCYFCASKQLQGLNDDVINSPTSGNVVVSLVLTMSIAGLLHTFALTCLLGQALCWGSND